MENNYERNFITEKLWEPILCETLVFYYGCPNVSQYIDSRAYVELDINDYEKSYNIIKKAIAEDWWSQRIDIIRQEKQRILNELAFFPTIDRIIKEDKSKIIEKIIPTPIPILIICYNNYKYVENTITQLISINKNYKNNIIIVNNSSTESDTRLYLDKIRTTFTVLDRANNGPWIDETRNTDLYKQLPDKYILTDPDLEFNKNLPNNFIEILSELSDKYNCKKIGFALDISDYDKMYQYNDYLFEQNIYDHENQFWRNKIDNKDYILYTASMDTKFFLYNKKYGCSEMSIRIAGNFTAKHLPWYIDNNLLTIEEKYIYNNYNIYSATSKFFLRYLDKMYNIVEDDNVSIKFAKKDNSTPTVCLCMIVKDEESNIYNTLENICTYIKFDYWVISDTGSTDNTKSIIKNFFNNKKIPGELIDIPWRDFGYNRTALISAAYTKTDYIFMWDADDCIAGNFSLPDTLYLDSYNFVFRENNGNTYNKLILLCNNLTWVYEGVLYEYPICLDTDIPTHTTIKGEYYFIPGTNGIRSKDPNKYIKDAIILEDAYNKSVKNKDEIATRYAYYCAYSCGKSGQYIKAIEFYKYVLGNSNVNSEKYTACLEIYNNYEKLNCIVEGLGYLVESTRYNTQPVECFYKLIHHYYKYGPYEFGYVYYKCIEHLFDKLDTMNIEKSLSDFYLPYYTLGVCCKHSNHHNICAKMYEIICKKQYTDVVDIKHIKCILDNLKYFVNYITDDIQFLYNLLEYIKKFHNEGYIFDKLEYESVDMLFQKYRKNLIVYKVPKNICSKKDNISVILTITSCKRLELFKQTINSLMNTWLDFHKIDYFLCVDDNSDSEDREYMQKMYPFFEYYMKTPEEKGHRQSMNIIFDKLAELKPKYWIHLEDDWLFFEKNTYVQKSIDFLDKYENDNIHQILFNRNYSEVYSHWVMNGGTRLDSEFLAHIVTNDLPLPNCAYWPHYSLRPSMTLVDKILDLGNYDSKNNFFERDYADKYYDKGYKSGFFDTISCIHIGKLTNQSGVNAYDLNNISQFNDSHILNNCKKIVINLKRRPDRKEIMQNMFNKYNIKNYEFFEGIDGNDIEATDDIKNLFKGNDFGNRKSFMGCALSHYCLWDRLINDADNDYYFIFEDDIKNIDKDMCQYFEKIINNKSFDMLFLGYHQIEDTDIEFNKSDNIVIKELNKELYIGGFFSYIIHKNGAKKIIEYINLNGIKHGIDYVVKIIPNLNLLEVEPKLIHSDWYRHSESKVDTDIQNNYDSLDM
jgi:GR25 family glycosyltransferase involved in LPS biosynthesis